jgi:murein L,D-transpeptidase YafK
VLLCLKDERRLEVYAAADDAFRRLVVYPVRAASGTLGPKLREGDRQVPEGVYAVESLNPNSRYHAALRVGYPGAFDRHTAAPEDRSRLGGDIMIHGGAASVGCLAMGDPAAEDLFVLAAAVGVENVSVVIAPVDLRTRPLPTHLDHDGPGRERYAAIRAEIARLPE